VTRIDDRPSLDTRDLQVVLAIASTGSTAGAVAVLHLTQSAVSRALASAEDKLGVRLFERSARGLAPTPAGERFIAGAGPMLAQLAEFERTVRAAERAPAKVRIVCECYTAYRWLPTALAALKQKLPHFQLALCVEHSRAPVEALVDGQVDVALLTTSSTSGLGSGFSEEPLFSDEIIFLVATSHPLASRRSLTKHDLEAATLISAEAPEAESRRFLRDVWGRARPNLDYLRLPLTEAIVDATRAGMGVAVLSEWIASSYLPDSQLLVKRLARPLHRPWRIAYRREARAAAHALTAALKGAGPRVFAAV
jgi:LysR family transcriptional regulator for metE and metH